MLDQSRGSQNQPLTFASEFGVVHVLILMCLMQCMGFRVEHSQTTLRERPVISAFKGGGDVGTAR